MTPLVKAAALLVGLSLQPATQSSSHSHVEAPARGTGVIRGRVVDATRGTSIGQAVVTASLWRSPYPTTSALRPARFTARTAADGSYVLTGLPKGEFTLSVERRGYLAAAGLRSPRPPSIALADGASVVAPDLALSRGGVITGRVLDEAGDPVIGAWVVPLRRPDAEPAQPLRESGPGVSTDDRGHFRLHGLHPGPHTVRATPRLVQQGPPPGPMQGDPRELLPGFAGGAGVETAQFVDVEAGAEVTLDVRLDRGLLTTVSGRVDTEDGTPLEQASISVRSVDPSVAVRFGGTRVLSGLFVLSEVPPGRYLLVAEEAPPATRSGPPPRGRAGWVSIDVDGTPLADVVVTIGHGATAEGRIEVDGGDPSLLDRAPVRVEARPPLYGALPGQGSDAMLTSERTFTLRGLRGRRQLRVSGLPPGWWVKSVIIGGRDALGGFDFPLRGTADPIAIVVSGRPTGVRGTANGTPDQLAGALAVAVPADAGAPSFDDPDRTRLAPVRLDGSFSLDGLRPGRYLVVAFAAEAVEARQAMTAEERRRVLEARGTPVDVVEGRVVNVTPRLVEQ